MPRRNRGAQRIAALARQTQRPVTQMTVLDQPAVELVEQLSLLAPCRITNRPVLQLGAQRPIRREIGLGRSEQGAVPRVQEMDESPYNIGIFTQRLRILVLVGQLSEPGAQWLDRPHRVLIEEHRRARRDRPKLQQFDDFARSHNLTVQVPSNQRRLDKRQEHQTPPPD